MTMKSWSCMIREGRKKVIVCLPSCPFTILFFLCYFSFLPLSSFAQKEKASLISVGHTSILDTYLSQEKASGTEIRYTWEKANRKPAETDGEGAAALRHWSSFVSQDAFFTSAGTRGNDNSFIGAMYNLRFGWHYNFDLMGGAVAKQQQTRHQQTELQGNRQTELTAQAEQQGNRQTVPPINLRVGLLADLALGGIYNTRNSNNPAQARASLNIDPSLMAAWHFKIKNKPFALRYEASMPLVGIAFSPNYGQSYYEIFTRGNYDHNVVFVSPASGVQFHQMLAFDFRLWRTTFTVGYLGDIRQMEANNLKYHQYSHNFVIGWRY